MDEKVIKQLASVSIPSLAGDARFCALDKLDAYHRSTQYDHFKYDWDGRYRGYGDTAPIQPGWYVPHRERKPSVNVEMGKLIVSRFTAMTMGEDQFPQVQVLGDADAEDYVKAMIRASRFESKLLEARDKGGACGTAVMSFAFVDGKPRVSVHRAKHMRVLQWHDRYEFRPAVVLKCYRYTRSELVDGRPKEVAYYYVRLWTMDSETVWEPIPEADARKEDWMARLPSHTVRHSYGECPVYWAQNLPDSDSEDGLSDFDGLLDDFDELNRLMSATSKGTIANVDPTLVVKMDPAANHGSLRKGSENAIFSPNGANYLELTGTSINTALGLAKQLIQYLLDVSGVVLVDPSQIAGAARSAAALRLIFKPMINQCNKIRSQYGDLLAAPMLEGMLRAARSVQSSGGEIYVTEDGRRVQDQPTISLPPRVETTYDDDGNATVRRTERAPGTAEDIDLRWPDYFKNTPQDVAAAVQSASNARGVLVSDRTATRFVAGDFGVEDVDAEVQMLKKEAEERAEMLPGLDMPSGGIDDDDEDEGLDENPDEEQ